MEGFHYVDLFATKGIEYLFVIAFLLTLVLFWTLLGRAGQARRQTAEDRVSAPRDPWFELRRGLFYHQGHTWALPDGADVVKVGVDDFAQKLIGIADELEVPEVGDRVVQGENGWSLRFGSKHVPLLSPVEGEVVEVNEEIRKSPRLINEDPYGKGWLLKIRVPRLKANLKNLITESLAQTWMEATVDALRHRMAMEHGALALQDGGSPVVGMGRHLSPEHWDEIAAEFLRTN